MSPSLEPLPLGLHSPVIDRARRLRERAGRREAGRFLIEGPTLLGDALAAGRMPAAVFGTAPAFAALDPALRAALRATNAFEVPPRAIEKLSDLESPPGLIAEMTIELTPVTSLFALADGAPVAILAGVSDPGNAGTLVRSAEIFGIRHVLFAEGGVEPYHPKVVRAAMGGHFRSVIGHAPGDEIAAAARLSQYEIVAAETGGEPLPTFVFGARTAIAIGSERQGVGRGLPGWERSVAIPHVGTGESLNAAIAGSIIFYAFAQRQRPEAPLTALPSV